MQKYRSQLTRFGCQKLRHLRAAIEHVQKALLAGVDQRDCLPKSANPSEHSEMPVRNEKNFRLHELVIPQPEELRQPNLCNLVDLPQAEICVVEMSSYAQPGRFSPADNLQGSPTPTDTSLLSYPNNEYCCGITQEVKELPLRGARCPSFPQKKGLQGSEFVASSLARELATRDGVWVWGLAPF